MSNLDFDHDFESDSLSAGNADRRKRQRKRRAQLTATPKASFPWSLVGQSILVVGLVGLASVLFDWLQPLELVAVTAATLAAMAFGYFVLNQRFVRLGIGGAGLLFGPVSCGLAVAISGLFLWSLHQFPSTHGYTDRAVASVEMQLKDLRSTRDHGLTKALLNEAIDTSDSEYWRQRWQNQLADLADRDEIKPTDDVTAKETTPVPIVEPEGPFTDQGQPDATPDASRPEKSDSSFQDADEEGSSVNAPADSTVHDGRADSPGISSPDDVPAPDEPANDNVLSRVVELQESNNFAAAELYLRKLLHEAPRSSWQCDYEQLYVDHWVDWGNAYEDLDQRHVCYLKALRTARGFRRDSSVLSAMLVRLERELQNQPKRLPAGCELQVHSVESDRKELVVELSVLLPDGEYMHDLVARDFRIRCGKTDRTDLEVASGDSRTGPIQRNVAVMVDLSSPERIIAEARLDAARRFIDRLPSGTAKLLVALSDHTELAGWVTDKRLDTIMISETPQSTVAPALRDAVLKTLDNLADRSGSKDLIIFSHGHENQEPYSTATNLVQKAKRLGVRIHAVVESPSKPSVRQLLQDVTQGTGGHFQSITPGMSDAAWQTVARYFPKGNFIVRVALDKDDCRDVRLTVGRGATLLYTVLDAPAELQL